MSRIDDMLDGAIEQSENQGHSIEDAYAFGVDGNNPGTGVPDETFEDDEPTEESISGNCPECGERGGLRAKWGKDRVEVHCTECGIELLEYAGDAVPSAILNSSDREGFSVRFRDS
jgi:Zn ribbon nucleic-acid-binding protein